MKVPGALRKPFQRNGLVSVLNLEKNWLAAAHALLRYGLGFRILPPYWNINWNRTNKHEVAIGCI